MEAEPRFIVSRPEPALAAADCACPEGGLAPTPFLSPTVSPQNTIADYPIGQSSPSQTWQAAPALYRADLPNGHCLVFNPFSFSNVVVLNDAATAILDAYLAPAPLSTALASLAALGMAAPVLEAALRQLVSLDLLLPAGTTPQPLRAQPHTLTAWLHVTNACNLRCHYCYLDKTDEAMAEETGIAAVEAVFRSAVLHGFRVVKLKYAGGEAMLNFALIETLHHHAQALAEQTGLALREVVLSNGVALARRHIELMRDLNIGLMISLDGIGEAHDAQRPFVNGKGSFAWVARSIDRAVQHGLKPQLSITVTGRSAAQLPAAVHFAMDRDLRFNLNFYRENECSASLADLRNDERQLVTGVKSAFDEIAGRLPQRRLIDGLIDHSAFNEPHEYACGAGHNYMVIDHHGGISRCQMEIERTITDVIAQDPLMALRTHTAGFQNVRVTEKSGCRDCAWKYWCAGGCSLLTFKATGRTDVQSPYCNVYKALYPEALRLEGLRLMKWGEG